MIAHNQTQKKDKTMADEETKTNACSDSSPLPCSADPVYVDMWALIFPDGRVITGTDLIKECDAWRVGLGWPTAAEVESAKAEGIFSQKIKARYYPQNVARQPRLEREAWKPLDERAC